MSADNGIYIAKFSDGYRAVHATAIENIDYYPAGSAERKNELKSYFGKAKIFATENEAYIEAKRLKEIILDDDFCPILEYGICYLGELEDF